MNDYQLVFTAGTHIDSAGNKHTFTEKDIEEIAKKYNEQNKHLAPLVKGHPQSNEPAHGWVEKLKAEGGKLYAKFKELSKEIINDVKEGRYKFPSISLYGDNLLRHVGLLGAVPPAVKGLGEFKFSEDIEGGEAIEYSFNEELEKGEVTELVGVYNETQNNISELETKIKEIKKLKQELKEYQENNSALENKIQFMDEEQRKAEEKLSELNLKMRTLQFEQYLNERVAYGNITPAQKEIIAKLLDALSSVNFEEREGVKGYEFSEYKDGKVIKTFGNPIELMKEFVESLKSGVKVNQEINNKDIDDPDTNKIIQQAKEYQEKELQNGRVIDFATALDKIKKQHKLN